MIKFWMVSGQGVPVVRHTSLSLAKSEAARLARKCPGESFTVMESIATVTVDNLKWEVHEDNKIPF
jgi:hypothetical protein